MGLRPFMSPVIAMWAPIIGTGWKEEPVVTRELQVSQPSPTEAETQTLQRTSQALCSVPLPPPDYLGPRETIALETPSLLARVTGDCLPNAPSTQPASVTGANLSKLQPSPLSLLPKHGQRGNPIPSLVCRGPECPQEPGNSCGFEWGEQVGDPPWHWFCLKARRGFAKEGCSCFPLKIRRASSRQRRALILLQGTRERVQSWGRRHPSRYPAQGAIAAFEESDLAVGLLCC